MMDTTQTLDSIDLSKKDSITALLVRYQLDEIDQDFTKRNDIDNKICYQLTHTDLGTCDGWRHAGETLFIYCLVKDFELAKHIITNVLADSEYNNCKSIERWDATKLTAADKLLDSAGIDLFSKIV